VLLDLEPVEKFVGVLENLRHQVVLIEVFNVVSFFLKLKVRIAAKLNVLDQGLVLA
jgi:hypothetical protein